jgi:hypothetical protein
LFGAFVKRLLCAPNRQAVSSRLLERVIDGFGTEVHERDIFINPAMRFYEQVGVTPPAPASEV